ncbi:MAG: glycosyltransferase [Deltaproteobacteria bacterium]|nr:glycosyltransferase [Deltaproteobacteria bacterium]
MNEPLVSIACITYNHEKYIAQAIEGFLLQKTSFPIEIIIHDDASTDNTKKNVEQYAKINPNLIFPIYQQVNQYSLGNKIFVKYVFPHCRGKYIAICEGDDYWTSPHKLQRQVDYLEKHPDIAGCFNNALVIDKDDKKIKDEWYDEQKQRRDNYKKRFNQEYCLTTLRSSYPSCGLMFRGTVLLNLPKWYLKTGSDYLLDLLITEYGNLVYLPFIGSAYRIHEKGIWQGANKIERLNMQLYRYIGLYSSKNMRSKYSAYLKNEILTFSFNISKEYDKLFDTRHYLLYKLLYYKYKFLTKLDMLKFRAPDVK